MNIFKKAIKEAKEVNQVIEAATALHQPKPEPQEEWVWVEGYKGTDRDMQCRDNFQYEIGPQYDIPDGQEVMACHSGFHFCLKLDDVFSYYSVGCGNRFFKVKALVREKDLNSYGTKTYGGYYIEKNDKLAAKSMIFTSELTMGEILELTDCKNLPDKYKQMAIEQNCDIAVKQYKLDTLLADGYSYPFATYIAIETNKFDIAHAVGSMKDVSMDVKVLYIMYNGKDNNNEWH